MSFQRYPLSTVQKVSQFIRETLVLPAVEPSALSTTAEPEWLQPDSLDALGDLFRVGDPAEETIPAPNDEGRWYISTIDPADALFKLPGLWTKAGIRLVTYLQRQPEGGLGLTWAMPELLSTTEHLEAAIATAGTNPPHPVGALPNVVEALEGDGSLSSFLSASIFLRELREFGRFGNQARWTHHRFVDAVPPKANWQWRTKPPQDLAPKVVTLPDGQIVVEFFSCRVVKPIALFRHVDRYSPNSYQAQNADQVIAVIATPSRSA
ncbi:MAG: hypothetical protein ICV77_02555 [Cyanobacteria bacterium Co-bin8]|nr:hypothetical protein [Cyanobacteria bacterium Co-bin8]